MWNSYDFENVVKLIHELSFFSVRDSQKEKELYEEAEAGNLAEVKHLLQTTFVDSNDNEFGNTPLLIAGKICSFCYFGY